MDPGGGSKVKLPEEIAKLIAEAEAKQTEAAPQPPTASPE